MEEKQHKRDSFVFHREWREAISGLPNKVRLEVYEAVFDFAIFGVSPKLSEHATIAFNFIRPVLERDIARYEDVREKRREAGSRGAQATNAIRCGDASAKSANAETCRQMSAKSADIIYGNGNGNVDGNVDGKKSVGKKKAADAATPPTIEFEEVYPATKPKRTKFVPPTIEDVVLYAAEDGLEIDAEGFFYFYESQGWRVGRNPMKDWKSAMKRWAREEAKKRNQQKQYGNAATDPKRQRDAELAEYLASKIQ